MVLIGLGSNRGDSVAIVLAAMDQLVAFAHGELCRSSLWRTTPVGCPPGSANFVNAVVAFEPRPGLIPEALLRELKALEKQYGRQPEPVRNAPRELDLDLLLFNDEQRDLPDLVLPHPRAVERLFVLAPAAEVVPDLVWPGHASTICALREELDTDERVELLYDSQVV